MTIASFYTPANRVNCGFRNYPESKYAFPFSDFDKVWKQWESSIAVAPSAEKKQRIAAAANKSYVAWSDLKELVTTQLRIPELLFPLFREQFFSEVIAANRCPNVMEVQFFWFFIAAKMDRVELLFRTLALSDDNSVKPADRVRILPGDIEELTKRIAFANQTLSFLTKPDPITGAYVCEQLRIYMKTVACRVFFAVNTSRTGKISLREFRHSAMVPVLSTLDEMTNLCDDSEPHFLSYLHANTIRCAFVQLQYDAAMHRLKSGAFLRNGSDGGGGSATLRLKMGVASDQFLREDFMMYGHSRDAFTNEETVQFSQTFLDRMSQVLPRAFSDGKKANGANVLQYEDFVYFYLSEKDFSTRPGAKYWFDLLDVDASRKLDGRVLQTEFFEKGVRADLAARFMHDPEFVYSLTKFQNGLLRKVEHRILADGSCVGGAGLEMDRVLATEHSRREFRKLVHLVTSPEEAKELICGSNSDDVVFGAKRGTALQQWALDHDGMLMVAPEYVSLDFVLEVSSQSAYLRRLSEEPCGEENGEPGWEEDDLIKAAFAAEEDAAVIDFSTEEMTTPVVRNRKRLREEDDSSLFLCLF